MVNINLLPEEARRHTTTRSGVSPWLVPVAFTALLGITASTLTLRQIQDGRALDDEIRTLTGEKERYRSQVALISEVERKRDDLGRRVEAARSLDTGRGSYVRQLSTIDAVLPGNVWLTGVTQEPGIGVLRIEGRSLGPAPVFMLMQGLDRSESFDEVTLEYLKKDPDQEEGSTAFVLTSRPM